MAKVSLKLAPSEKRANGEAPLYLVARHLDDRAKLSTGITLKPKDWNDRTSEVRKSHPDQTRINRRLQALLSEAHDELADLVHDGPRRGERVTAQKIRDRVDARIRGVEDEEPEEVADFIAYTRDLVPAFRPGTREVYSAALGKLEAFWKAESGGSTLPFEDVTAQVLRRFYSYLTRPEAEGGLGNKLNTAHKSWTSLSRFYRQALDEGVAPYGPNPFKQVKVKKEKVQKEKLTMDEVRSLATADLGPEDGLLNRVREWWMFAFFAGGMRFSDVALLERRHLVADEGPDGGEEVRVAYRMKKTGDHHALVLVPEALVILDRRGWREMAAGARVFEILDGYDLSTEESRHKAIGSRNSLANNYLQEVAKRARIVDESGAPRRVGFHLSRHSLAGYLLESGTDVHTIKEVMAHSSVAQTEQYLAGFSRSTADDVMRGIKL